MDESCRAHRASRKRNACDHQGGDAQTGSANSGHESAMDVGSIGSFPGQAAIQPAVAGNFRRSGVDAFSVRYLRCHFASCNAAHKRNRNPHGARRRSRYHPAPGGWPVPTADRGRHHYRIGRRPGSESVTVWTRLRRRSA